MTMWKHSLDLIEGRLRGCDGLGDAQNGRKSFCCVKVRAVTVVGNESHGSSRRQIHDSTSGTAASWCSFEDPHPKLGLVTAYS